MIKYDQLPQYDIYGNPTVTVITQRGSQSGNGVKVAQYNSLGDEIRAFIDTIKPKEGYAYLLISAMGDQNWGPNRNGDWWPTIGLSNPTEEFGYKTFEKYGHWYHHHENKDPKESFGKVIKSVWNDMMSRIELIVEVDLVKDTETKAMLDSGLVIMTSMGSRVSADLCKICHPNWKEYYKIPEEYFKGKREYDSDGNVTKEIIKGLIHEESLDNIYAIGDKFGVDLRYITEINPPAIKVVQIDDPERPGLKKEEKTEYTGGPVGISQDSCQYCFHMKYMKNMMLPSGERVCVVNLRPRGFDISLVSSNADRSSFVLSKVASDIGGATITTDSEYDELIEKQSNETNKVADTDKSADMEKESPGAVIADGPTDIEKYYLQNICPAMYEREKEIPDDVMDSISEKFPVEKILSSMLGMGMYPHPREFTRIILIQSGKKDELKDFDAKGIHLTPDNIASQVIPRMSGDIEDNINMGPEQVDPEIIKMLAPFFWDRSNYRQPVAKRIIMIKTGEEQPVNQYLVEPEKLKRPSLLPPLLASVGALYLANTLGTAREKMNGIIGSMSNNRLLWGASLAGALIAASIVNGSKREMEANEAFNKTSATIPAGVQNAAKNTWNAAKILGPTLGTYMLAGHIINKAQSGDTISWPEKFVAKHPIITSVTATLAVNKPSLFKGIFNTGKKMFKKAEEIGWNGINVDDYPSDQKDKIGILIWDRDNEEIT